MRKLKAPFNNFNPEMPKRQREALRRVYAALKRRNTLRFFSWALNAKGQVELHVLQGSWGTYASRSLRIGKHGGLLFNRRYIGVKAWLK